MKAHIFILTTLALLIFSACKKDPCDGVSCKNGGDCVNGECSCPTGFTGPDCGTRIVPSSITVRQIVVNDFPLVDASGGAWDLSSGADLYVRVDQGGNYVGQTTAYPNTVATPVAYTDEFILVKSAESVCFSLYDYDDFDSDDFIGGVCFDPFDSSNTGFPATLPLTCGTCNAAIEISLDYDF
jgi:hypothetical protein